MLYACNLRCTFCYTDSPRQTIAGTPSLADDEWRRLAEESISLGIVEVVLTGGEPLMRPELTLELAERFAAAGVGVTLNTNGWFLDDEIADRLAEIPNLSTHVSIDGPSPELHDAGRGVPGSWRRAVLAVDRLLVRGLNHLVVSVVLPPTLPRLDDHLELMHALGLRAMRITPVAEIGAAARLRGQHVSRRKLLEAVARYRRRHASGMRITVQHGNAGAIPTRDRAAPAAFLVRPNGAVLTDSLQPFAFGNAVRSGLEECWERIRTGWRDPRIDQWAQSIAGSDKIREASVVPYLSDELDLSGEDAEPPEKHLDAPLPKLAGPREAELEPLEFVRSLALDRRYATESLRVGGGESETYVRKLDDGRIVRVNETARAILAALDGGSCGEAVDRLAERYPGVARDSLTDDVLETARALRDRGFVRGALAPRGQPMSVGQGTSDLPEAVPGADAAE